MKVYYLSERREREGERAAVTNYGSLILWYTAVERNEAGWRRMAIVRIVVAPFPPLPFVPIFHDNIKSFISIPKNCDARVNASVCCTQRVKTSPFFFSSPSRRVVGKWGGEAIKMANNIIQICRSDWFYDFSSRRFANVDVHSQPPGCVSHSPLFIPII